MTRYWRNTAAPCLIVTTNQDFAHPKDWTEVRVVDMEATVIDPSELPEVKNFAYDSYVTVGPAAPTIFVADDATPERHEQDALQHLAIARYLREHPPVRPNVRRLADALDAADEAVPSGNDRREAFLKIAELLDADGWIRP